MITLPVVLAVGAALVGASLWLGTRSQGAGSSVAFRAAGLAAVATLVVAVGHLYPRYGADRVSHMLDWGGGCDGMVHEYRSPWGGSSRVHVTQIECGHLGPVIRYAKFPSADAVDPDVAGAMDVRYCVAGREVVVDLLADPVPKGAFVQLCRKMGGVLRKGHHPLPPLALG